jgi:hypothetical protein
VRAECKEHDVLGKTGNYCDYARVAEEDYDVVPISHPHIFCRQFPLVDMNDLVLVLQGLYGMGKEYERRRQRKTLNRAMLTELIMTR